MTLSVRDERVLVVATAAATAAVIGLGAFIWYRTQLRYLVPPDDPDRGADPPHRSARRVSDSSSSRPDGARQVEGSGGRRGTRGGHVRRGGDATGSPRRHPRAPPPADSTRPHAEAPWGGDGDADDARGAIPKLQLSGAAAAMLTMVSEDLEGLEPAAQATPAGLPIPQPPVPTPGPPKRARRQQPVFLSPHSQQQLERQQQQRQPSAGPERPLSRAGAEAQPPAELPQRPLPRAVLEAQDKARAAANAPPRPLPRAVLEAQAKARAEAEAGGSTSASSRSVDSASHRSSSTARTPPAPSAMSSTPGDYSYKAPHPFRMLGCPNLSHSKRCFPIVVGSLSEHLRRAPRKHRCLQLVGLPAAAIFPWNRHKPAPPLRQRPASVRESESDCLLAQLDLVTSWNHVFMPHVHQKAVSLAWPHTEVCGAGPGLRRIMLPGR